jgi:hypothetical protein
MTAENSTLASAPGIVLLPAARFFARRVPRVAGADAAGQAELALEGLAPFPVDQLCHGCVANDGEMLVFGAYRKQFTADETAAWESADAVVPSFVALLGAPPVRPRLQVWRNGDDVTVAAWDGKSALPAALVARNTADDAQVSALVEEVRSRAGLPDAPVMEISGQATVDRAADGRGLSVAVGAGADRVAGTIDHAVVATVDVREKGFLAERRRTLKRDRWLWHGLVGCAAVLVVLALAELAMVGGRFGLARYRAGVQQAAPAVAQIETAQALSQRIEEMSARRLMPAEMIAVLNRSRPASVLFVRATTTGQFGMEVEAQTANAGDIGAYEAALRGAPEIAALETRDLRSREGTTSFILSATFKAGSLTAGGAP